MKEEKIKCPQCNIEINLSKSSTMICKKRVKEVFEKHWGWFASLWCKTAIEKELGLEE